MALSDILTKITARRDRLISILTARGVEIASDATVKQCLDALALFLQVELSGTASYSVSGKKGHALTQALDVTASDGSAPAYEVTQGTLPAGLTLSNGVISGTPTATGTSTVKITATSGNASFVVTVNFAIAEPVTLSGTTSYNVTGYKDCYGKILESDTASSDGSEITYKIIEGTLPDGLRLDSYGLTYQMWLGGTPTAAGTSTVKIRAASVDGETLDITVTITIQTPVISGTYAYVVEHSGTAAVNLTFDCVSSSGQGVSYAAAGTLPDGLTLSGGKLTGNVTTSEATLAIPIIASASGAVSQTITVTLTNIGMADPGTLAPTTSLTLIAPDDLSLYAGGSPDGHYWSDDDELSVAVYNGDTLLTNSCTGYDGTAFVYGKLNYMCAGNRVLVDVGTKPSGIDSATLTIQWRRGETVVKTESRTYDWLHHPQYFTRPSGDGNWTLKINGSAATAQVWSGGAWTAFPSGGLGPDYAGHAVRVTPDPALDAIACWSNDGADGDPFWYLT